MEIVERKTAVRIPVRVRHAAGSGEDGAGYARGGGLRTGDRYAQWPEEMNRRIGDAICDRRYAPTEGTRQTCWPKGSRTPASSR